jgi:hypothetical protein
MTHADQHSSNRQRKLVADARRPVPRWTVRWLPGGFAATPLLSSWYGTCFCTWRLGRLKFTPTPGWDRRRRCSLTRDRLRQHALSSDGGKISLPGSQGWRFRPYAGWNARKVVSRPTLIPSRRFARYLKTRESSSSDLRIWEFVFGFSPKQPPVRRKMEKLALLLPERARPMAGWSDDLHRGPFWRDHAGVSIAHRTVSFCLS